MFYLFPSLGLEIGGGLIIDGKVEVYSTIKESEEKSIKAEVVDTVDSSLTNDSSSALTTAASAPATAAMTSSGATLIPDPSSVHVKAESTAAAASAATATTVAPVKGSVKLIADLIQTLNETFVDYDFSEVQASSFSTVKVAEAIQSINSQLGELSWQSPSYMNNLWREIDECIGTLASCDVYKLDDEVITEMDDGVVWCVNYFFCNKELKRVCYFMCNASNKYRDSYDALGFDGEYPSSQGDDGADPTTNDEREGDESDTEDAYSVTDNN